MLLSAKYYLRYVLILDRTDFAAIHTPASSNTKAFNQPQEEPAAERFAENVIPNPQFERPPQQSFWSMLKPGNAEAIKKSSSNDATNKP